MQSEVIIAIIGALSPIFVALITQYFTNRKKNHHPAQDTHANVKHNTDPTFKALNDKRRSAFNDQEESYNELTLRVAEFILTENEDLKAIIRELMDECKENEDKYNKVNRDFLNHILDISH